MSDFVQAVMKLQEVCARAGGKLEEVWVDRVIYDALSLEIMEKAIKSKNAEADSGKWTNGLIQIHAPTGYATIRRKS